MVMPWRCFQSSRLCIIERAVCSSISSNGSLSPPPRSLPSRKFHRMSALPSSFVSIGDTRTPFFSGSVSMQVDQFLSSRNLIISTTYPGKAKPPKLRRSFTVQASRDTGRPSTASIFFGGFVLGGTIVGTLGCIFAPQISKALAGADRKDLMRKLPKFIYDEEKALEKTRKILTEKIAQLNSAIDDVSAQLHADDDDGAPNGVAVNPDELEASI